MTNGSLQLRDSARISLDFPHRLLERIVQEPLALYHYKAQWRLAWPSPVDRIGPDR